MSFLDVMFCGFGSVILLVMIVNANALTKREKLHEDLRGEVERLEREVLVGEKYLVELRTSIEHTQDRRQSVRADTRSVREAIERVRAGIAALEERTLARTEHINALQADLKSLDERSERLEADLEREEEKGEQVRAFIGSGDRQYLTGLRMGGKRILILVDTSASMLDETIVNVIRRRNLSEERRRASPKWQQALATVEWLLARLPPESRYHVTTFGVDAAAALDTARGAGWLEATDTESMDAVVGALRERVPAGGTSLHGAFEAAAGLEPRPDNIYLLTDGLPTQGAGKPFGNKVSGKRRLRYFRQATRKLPPGVPVNVVLFPIEGDPFAASEFWKLAVRTNGSMISPSRDWP